MIFDNLFFKWLSLEWTMWHTVEKVPMFQGWILSYLDYYKCHWDCEWGFPTSGPGSSNFTLALYTYSEGLHLIAVVKSLLSMERGKTNKWNVTDHTFGQSLLEGIEVALGWTERKWRKQLCVRWKKKGSWGRNTAYFLRPCRSWDANYELQHKQFESSRGLLLHPSALHVL